MRLKKTIIHWIYPFIVGIIAFNMLRVISDLAINNPFWHGDKQPHILGLIFTTLFCYIMDIIWRCRFEKPNNDKSILKEYLFIFAELYILSTIFLFFCVAIKVAFIKDFTNYLLIVISYIPILMLYYTLLRNERVDNKYQEKLLQLEKLKADQSKTELLFLKSQYHPHFLFNALNTIYFQVKEENKIAKRSIEQLSDLLRYQLYDIHQEVTLSQEVNFLKSYIAFQQQRMSDRFVLDTYFDPNLSEQKIHPLLFQPLIENAFKYVGGDLRIKLELKPEGEYVCLIIENSISAKRLANKEDKKGIGLENLKRRLELLYPERYSLYSNQTKDAFTVILKIKLD